MYVGPALLFRRSVTEISGHQFVVRSQRADRFAGRCCYFVNQQSSVGNENVEVETTDSRLPIADCR